MQNLHFLEESHEKIYLVYMYSFLIFLFWGRPAHLEAVSISFSRQKSWTWSMTYPGSGVWWNTKWVNRRMDNLYCFPFFQALLEPCEVVAVAPPSSFCDPGPPIVGPKPPSSSHLDCKSLVKENWIIMWNVGWGRDAKSNLIGTDATLGGGWVKCLFSQRLKQRPFC